MNQHRRRPKRDPFRLFLVAMSAAFVLAPAATAKNVLQMRLSSYVMAAPAALRVSIFVERQDSHRWLTIEADSQQFYRKSVIQLDGASAPRRHYLEYFHLPEGEYVIRVELKGDRDTLAMQEQHAVVTGPAADLMKDP
jgi:hypothetical protein